jgi:antitoxin MazE
MRAVIPKDGSTTLTFRTRTVQIGNSRGIRLPVCLLEQADLPEEVEVYAEPERLVVRAARGPRDGWAEAARAMRARGEDGLPPSVRSGNSFAEPKKRPRLRVNDLVRRVTASNRHDEVQTGTPVGRKAAPRTTRLRPGFRASVDPDEAKK